jgi:hypothetical protein
MKVYKIEIRFTGSWVTVEPDSGTWVVGDGIEVNTVAAAEVIVRERMLAVSRTLNAPENSETTVEVFFETESDTLDAMYDALGHSSISSDVSSKRFEDAPGGFRERFTLPLTKPTPV